MRPSILLFAALSLTGCGPGFGHPDSPSADLTPVCYNPEFSEERHAAYEHPGTGRIYGEAFLMTRGGAVKYAQGHVITLIPDTDYGMAYMWDHVQQTNGRPCWVPNARFTKLVRQVPGDSQGQFLFDKLPPGQYRLHVRIFWELPKTRQERKRIIDIPQYSGGELTEFVTLAEGEEKRVILTEHR